MFPSPGPGKTSHMARRIAVLVSLVIALVAAQPAAAHHREAGPRAWMTTGDQTNLLTEQPSTAFGDPVAGDPTITIDPSQAYQRMAGFGASITDSSAHLLAESSHRDQIMRDLFNPRQGLGLSYLRQPMGASDFVAGPHYTYDDMPAGQTDFQMRRFSIDHDRAQILPLLRQALALNPNLKIMGTPWSPPAWMKTNDSLIGGRLIDDPRIYQAYADYLVKFVQAYQAAGVPIYGLTIQNEPQNRTPNGYPGTDLPTRQAIAVIERLGPALQAAGLDTKIMGYDHNWSEHPNDIANTPPGEDPETEYPTLLLESRAARWIAGTAFHCYAGDPKRMTALHRAFPNKEIWFTECSGSHGPSDPPAQVFSDTLKWHARNI